MSTAVPFRQTQWGPVMIEHDPRPVASFDDTLAPGVNGYTVDTPDGLYIGAIAATTPGNGDVGRYLDALPRDRRVVFPNVLSDRLEGMLARRGFTRTDEWAEEFGEFVEVWQRG